MEIDRKSSPEEPIPMRTVTFKSYERTASAPQLGGPIRHLRYTEVTNQDAVTEIVDGEPVTYAARQLVLFSSLRTGRR